MPTKLPKKAALPRFPCFAVLPSLRSHLWHATRTYKYPEEVSYTGHYGICSGISPIFIKPMQAISISVLPGLVIGKRSKTNGKIRVRGRYGQPLCKIGRKRGDNIPLLRRHGFYRPVIQQNHEWHIHNRKKENADSFLHAGICCR